MCCRVSNHAWTVASFLQQSTPCTHVHMQVVHGFSIPGLKTRHSDLDIVVIRENTEGEYSGLGERGVRGEVRHSIRPANPHMQSKLAQTVDLELLCNVRVVVFKGVLMQRRRAHGSYMQQSKRRSGCT